MKRKDFMTELKDASTEDLLEKSRGIAEEIMRLRFKKGVGQLDDSTRIKLLKRNLARVNTVIRSSQA